MPRKQRVPTTSKPVIVPPQRPVSSIKMNKEILKLRIELLESKIHLLENIFDNAWDIFDKDSNYIPVGKLVIDRYGKYISDKAKEELMK